MIIVVGDAPSSVAHGRPIQDGGRADTSAPIGIVSLWGVYVYYVYVTKPTDVIGTLSVHLLYCRGQRSPLSVVPCEPKSGIP